MTPKVRQKLSGLFYPCAADDDEFIAVVALVAKATHSGEILDADKSGHWQYDQMSIEIISSDSLL